VTRLAAWTKKHAITVMKDLPPFFWMKGYFFSRTKGPQGETILNQNLHEVLTREYFLAALGEIQGRRFLDIGCAVGDYMAVIAEMGGIVSGVDVDADEIARGKANLAKAGLQADFHVGDARALPFDDAQFDVIYSADVFEHLTYDTKQAVVAELYRVLKPGGRVVIKTPNLDYLRVSINLRRLKRPYAQQPRQRAYRPDHLPRTRPHLWGAPVLGVAGHCGSLPSWAVVHLA
jgi:2-polyprenyl-3-methyl-5-hydroxy-6-metoxy-1,4-benzoquinol methylase